MIDANMPIFVKGRMRIKPLETSFGGLSILLLRVPTWRPFELVMVTTLLSFIVEY